MNPFICLVLLTATVVLVDAVRHNATSSMRLRKMQLIRKHMKKQRKHEGAVRLVNGSNDHEGNVEVFHFGHWGSVCDDEFDERDAQVICRQLGFPGVVKATHNSHFGPAHHERFWMDNLYCTGEEKLLSACRFDGWGSSDCTVAESAGVVCQNDATTTTTTNTPRPQGLS